MKTPEDNGAGGVDAPTRKDVPAPQAADRTGAEKSRNQPPLAEEKAQPVPGDAPQAGASAPSGTKPKPPRKSILKRPAFLIFLAVMVVAIILTTLYWWVYKRPFETTDDAFIGADIVEIAPQVSGQIISVPIESNTHVKAGELLAHIDPAPFKAKLAAARAQLEQAKAGLKQAEVGVDQAESQEAESEASLNALQVTAENDQVTLTRDLKLQKAASSPITQKQVDDDRAAARAAAAQAEAGQKAVSTAKTAIDVAKAKVTSAKASVDAAQSQVESAQLQLDYTTITAPLDGQIVQKNINVGSFATQGQAMMALVPDKIYVTANFKETQLSDIRVGQSVSLYVDAFPDVKFHGKVVSIQHGAGQAFQLLPAQNATGNFVKVVQRVPVRISISAKDLSKYPLGPGMSVVPSIRVR